MTKLLVILTVCLISSPVLAAETIIINQPNGGQTVCISQGGYMTCY